MLCFTHSRLLYSYESKYKTRFPYHHFFSKTLFSRGPVCVVVNVIALSETINVGIPLLAANLLSALRNVDLFKSLTKLRVTKLPNHLIPSNASWPQLRLLIPISIYYSLHIRDPRILLQFGGPALLSIFAAVYIILHYYIYYVLNTKLNFKRF